MSLRASLVCSARLGVAFAALLAVAGPSTAAPPKPSEPTRSPTPTPSVPTRLTLDHKTGQAFLAIPGRTPTPVENESRKRVPTSRRVIVQIDHTNTALYSFVVTDTKVKPEEVAAIRGFWGGLKPYLTEAATRIAGFDASLTQETKALAERPERGNRAAPLVKRYNALVEVITQLKRINDAVFGPKGIRDTEIRALQTLAEMAWAGSAPEELAETLRKAISDRFEYTPGTEKSYSCSSPADGIRRLTAVKTLTEALLALAEGLSQLGDNEPTKILEEVASLRSKGGLTPEERKAIREIEAKMMELGTVEDIEAVLASAKEALSEAGPVIEAAIAVERLARRVVEARSTWCSDPIEISGMVGKEVNIKVVARTDPELAHHPLLEFHATLLPNWPVRPALGLTFLGSPDSRFPKYAAKEVGMGFRVVQSDEQDSRFTYGLTLAITWQGLDHRDERNKRWAIWIPELTVNPSDDVRAFGLGAGFSFWKILKISGGILWTKHKVLVGQSLGEILPAEDALRLRDAYGKPNKWYIGISLIGWPPFVPAP